MSRVVTAMENLNSNLPPTLSHSQVSSVRKHLKMQLLNILKHPACGESRSMVMQLLIDLGYTNQELAKLAPRPPIEEKKRIPKRSLEPSTIPQLYNKKAKFNEDLDKIEEIEKLKHEASEVNESFILQNLNNNMVINIIVASMKNFPSTIPGHFPGDYSRAIANGTDLVQIAKLLAEQFTEADVGPGIKIYNSKEHGIEQKINERIDSPKQEVENGGNTKALLDKLNREIKKASPGVNSVRPVKVKTLKLSEITKPLPNRVRDQMLIDTVKRVLQAEKYLVKVGVTHTRHKIVTTFASMFSSAVQEVILHFLLEDLRSHMDLALAWLYEEYSRMQGFCRTPAILRREEKPDQSYNALLCSLISSLQKGNELLKDRDGLMARLYLEAPFVTNEALELLKQQCMRVERSPSALNLVHDLVVRRPPCGASFLHALLSLTIFADATIREGAVARIVSIYERSEWRQTIEDFALQHLEALRLPEPPADNNPTEETAPNTWTDELAKANLCLYMALLPYNESLVHELSRIYVQTSADVKRTILRLLEQPVRGMGMDSPELLLLVERCPKGAETLVTRIIHILSDRGPPSAQLVSRVRELYHSRVSDVRFLIPVLNGLTKKEITSALPKLIKLNPVVVKEVFNRLLGLHGGGDPPISPSELLIALHLLDPAKVEIKSIMKATSLCFAEKQVYTQEVLAVVMQQLMDVTPLPTLLMRTVIQSLTLYPRLTGFVMNILQRLIVKQVWRQKVVWEGFIKCCQRTKPQSFQVLLQLPHAQLSEALTVCPDMLLPLQEHVRSLTETQRAHIPSSVMDVILGANNNSSPSDAISSAAAANITSDLAVDTPMIPSPTTPVNIEPGSIEPLPPGME